jgi:hypothetical protein
MIRKSVKARNIEANAMGEAASGGRLCGYSGSMPSSVEDAANATKLFECGPILTQALESRPNLIKVNRHTLQRTQTRSA